MSETVFIAFGSNIDQPILQLAKARESLRQQLTEIGASRLYRTAPWGYTAQEDFYNAVVAYQCSLEPLELLAFLQSIEREQGRERPFKNAPRTLDLDILFYGYKNSADSTLTIPHPAISQRIFVLAPLCDLTPQRLLNGKKISDLLADLPWEGIEIIEHPNWQPKRINKDE